MSGTESSAVTATLHRRSSPRGDASRSATRGGLGAITALAVSLALAGCGGPATPSELPAVRMNYNEALVRSANEQLLLNLVRLRYLHAPQFFEVTAITTQSAVTTSGNAGIGGNFGNNLTDNTIFTPWATLSLGGSVSVEDRPTVSYQPLQGEAFAERMVRPIQPHTLLSLVGVGWRIDRLLACCVQRINDVNAPVLASTDDAYASEDFGRLGDVLYGLQLRGALEIGVVQVGESHQLRLSFVPVRGDAGASALIAEAQSLLGVDPALRSYRVLDSYVPPAPAQSGEETEPAEETEPVEGDEAEARADAAEPRTTTPSAEHDAHVVLRVRSLLGALFYLSHGVEVPEGEAAARSLGYTDLEGEAVDVPTHLAGALLDIRSSAEPPTGAYVLTRYRDLWFYIEDQDLRSKQVFLLLQVLFSVLSASSDGGPVLTIPVGG